MTTDKRTEIQDKAFEKLFRYDNLLLKWGTGTGKSRVAILACDYIVESAIDTPHILIFVAERAHKDNWKKEFVKFLGKERAESVLHYVTIECYASMKKYADTEWDFIVFDECFRGDTEILTDSGYKRFDALDGTEKVAQFTDSGNIEFVHPIRFIKKPYIGSLIKLNLGRDRSCYMTPGHNQVFRTKSSPEWKVEEIGKLKLGTKYIPVSGKGTGNNEELTWMERLLIAIQADGTLQRHQINESVYSIQVTKERKAERLCLFASHLPQMNQISSGTRHLCRYLCKLPKGDAKLLSTHFSVDMGYDRANQFIDEVLNWDGSYLEGNSVYYSSKVKENADFVAAVAVQAGYKVLQSVEHDNRKDSYSNIYRVYMRKLEQTSGQVMSKELIDYAGNVYCVEVPSHKIVVRSQGYTFISGNCHHLQSEKRQEMLETMKAEYVLALSATPGKAAYDALSWTFGRFEIDEVSIQDAIDSEYLPEPRIVCIPLKLERFERTETIDMKMSSRTVITISDNWSNRWKYLRNKQKYARYEIIFHCTQKEKYEYINEQFEYWKRQYFRNQGNERLKNMWLQWGSRRKRFLGELKTTRAFELINGLRKDGRRFICFCSSIEQAHSLGGERAVHSQNKNSPAVIQSFNDKKIDEIFAVGMLVEGVTLTDIEAGIIVQLDGNERQFIQKSGRMYRSENPLIYIFYYKGTRDEEYLQKALEGINEEYVKYGDNNQ